MTTFDAYTRHQVYVEGYKNGQAQDAETLYEEITAAIIISLNKLALNNMGELTKKALLALTRDVTARMKKLFGKQIELTTEAIKAFMNVDLRIMAALTQDASGKPFPVNTMNRDTLWSRIFNDPMGATGVTPGDAFLEAQTAAIAAVVAAIRAAWADNVELAAFIRSLVGTRALLFKDGLLARQRRRFATAIETGIQHVTTGVQFQLGRLTASHYVWCSILDSRTTEICRSRNGVSYEYGSGPRPPAHWNCRSFTIPATIVNVEEIPTFYTWIKRQPSGVQDDVLGPTRGRELRDGRIKADQLPGFDRARPLTVSEYGDKLNKILAEVA
jgi:hypothetical protein